jgi:hypothetical protein
LAGNKWGLKIGSKSGDGFGAKCELAWLDRLNCRERLAGAEVFKENVGEDLHLRWGKSPGGRTT